MSVAESLISKPCHKVGEVRCGRWNNTSVSNSEVGNFGIHSSKSNFQNGPLSCIIQQNRTIKYFKDFYVQKQHIFQLYLENQTTNKYNLYANDIIIRLNFFGINFI